MKYNPKIHNRQSIRLKGWDYSQKGKYFITINIQNRLHLLGNINNGDMILNDAGMMVKKWNRFEKRLWQLRYHDHIIRNENDYIRISNYIKNNPTKWDEYKLK